MADRLKSAREAAGFATVPEACLRFGWKQSTYFGHENGSRGITPRMAAEYGRAFRVSPEWILFGGASAPAPVAPSEPDDLVSVYNVEASAGHGALVDSEMIVDRLSFPPGYLRRITSAKPKDLAIIGVKGNEHGAHAVG